MTASDMHTAGMHRQMCSIKTKHLRLRGKMQMAGSGQAVQLPCSPHCLTCQSVSAPAGLFAIPLVKQQGRTCACSLPGMIEDATGSLLD